MVTMCTTCCNIKQLQFDRAVCVLNHSNNVHCMVPVLHTHTHTHTHTPPCIGGTKRDFTHYFAVRRDELQLAGMTMNPSWL